MKRTQVVLADDHAVLREGLRALLKVHADLEVVAEASTSQEAVDHVARTLPEVVCLDLSMPGFGLAATIQRIKTASPTTHVLILSMHDDAAYVRSALAAGADGYILKSSETSVLLAGIRAAANGQPMVDPALVDSLQVAPLPASGPTPLSRREQQVIALLARGHTHQEIADRLFVSVKSIETYRARIREKTGLRTRADFVRYGLDAGLIDPHGIADPPSEVDHEH